MGLADFITQDFYNDIDFAVTYENVMTSSFIKRGRMPMVARMMPGNRMGLKGNGPQKARGYPCHEDTIYPGTGGVAGFPGCPGENYERSRL